MKRTRKRFMLVAMLSVALSLAMLLALINVVLKTHAAEDADHLTQRISEHQGTIGWQPGPRPVRFENGRPVDGAHGADSPDMQASLRYFTCVFNEEGDGSVLAYSIGSVTRDQALDWAKSLLTERRTGWTARIYRYRVWTTETLTYVTVIDQGRELVGYYRVLRISLIGYAVMLALSFALLMWARKRIFQPLEAAERTRSRALAMIEHNFRIPLTVMSAGIDNLEQQYGSTEQSQLVRRQLTRMINEVRAISQEDGTVSSAPVSSLAENVAAEYRADLEARGIRLDVSCEEGLNAEVNAEAFQDILRELFENVHLYAKRQANLTVRGDNGRVLLEMSNDADLPDGEYDQVFDRETRLSNAAGVSGAGLGLNRVRGKVRQLNGRISARVKDGVFTIRLSL